MMRLRFASPAFSLVASGLLVSGLFVQSAAAFSDVPAGHESRRAIEYLQREGILQGYADGLFRPAFPINRAEFLKVLVGTSGGVPGLEHASCFPDVQDQWFAPYVCFAQYQGWVQGYPDGTFGPERQVTFVEALKMLANARGYPMAPPDEIAKRGLDPASWFSPYLTTAVLLDVVSYEQVWGPKATPLQAPLNRAAVSQLLYRALLAEGLITTPLFSANCTLSPSFLEVRTYVDVAQPSGANVFRQDLHGVDDAGTSCLLVTDANPFGRVGFTFDPYFLQPYPDGQPKDSWTARVPLAGGRAVLRGGKLEGTFRPEVFVADVIGGVFRQLPSIFASSGGSQESPDGRYVVYVGAAGTTLEAVDLTLGTHMVIDAVQAPLTFLSSRSGGQSVSFPSEYFNVAAYTLYDSSITRGDEYLVLEERTVDIDASFGVQAQPAPADPYDPYASSSSAPWSSSASSTSSSDLLNDPFYDPFYDPSVQP